MSNDPLANLDDFTLSLTEEDMEQIILGELPASEKKPPKIKHAEGPLVPAPDPEPELDTTTGDFQGDDDDADSILSALDIGAYPRLMAGGLNDSVTFCEVFLPAVKDAYDAKGWGAFECILVFRFNGVNDSHVSAFNRSVTARISRLRKLRPGIAPFRVVHAHHEILSDRKHVAIRCIRMSEARYAEWYKKDRARLARDNSVDRKLAPYL